MITKDNLANLLTHFEFTQHNNTFKREYPQGGTIEVDMNARTITYAPLDSLFKEGEFPSKEKPANGFVIHRNTTLNFSHNENFVCLVCVHLLLKKGYEPKHIVLEPAFEVGHINKPSYGDILVFDKEYNPLALIENKTFGTEFSKEWNNMQKDGGQLFSYFGPLVNKLGFCENIVLFAADFEEKIIPKSYIITLKDSEKRIRELDNPKTFRDAQGRYFEVWSETYAKSFETKGLFEEDIEAYSIGKLKYTINDLKELSHAEIRPIYNEFATILRNHAITDFEHSFYILIDLFLCKITDELNNPEDLQFYYRGITRDTPKEYCSRLLKLYQLGKKQLFDVDVVNKEESDIRQIFEDTNRSITNGLFTGIKELFEEIKFYNIRKFNFIEVENKEEFEMNFQILIKIASLIQDINLSNSETNHFFGDLFEGLLSKNVHQTEGQFFTPLPIVNFIIKSLPHFSNSNNVKVLDFACGAGHFLTEFVKSYPESKAFGIEKSQPLSQVAKIATIINGAKESHIVFKDSLSILNTKEIRFQGFDKESFDCIIANPPYSVKGFLSTLTDNDRNLFDLTRFVEEDKFDKNSAIECFFVERAKHFLKTNGILGIVLPNSILTKGNLYKTVRELIFSHFNILAIVNLGSRTFGSTGTNTIVLFAQKVKKNSEGLLHTFLEKKDYTQYLNYQAIDSYIKKQGYRKEDFFAFMQDSELNANLEVHEVFGDYKKNFKPRNVNKTTQKEWFKESSLFKADLNERSKEYRKQLSDYLKTEEYKNREETEYKKQFVSFAKEIEKDKLNTFIQIESNAVIILQSPPDKIGSKSNKPEVIKFLGYDWSSRKGDEGIKYITSRMATDSDESEDDKDAEVMNAVNSIKFIDTPLYNPNDDYDCTKFAYAIRKHIVTHCKKFSFIDASETNSKLHQDYEGEMDELLSTARLTDLVDFSRATFDKEIKTNLHFEVERVDTESKYPLKCVENILVKVKGLKTKIKKNNILDHGKYPVITQESEEYISGDTDNTGCITDLPLIVFGDHSCTFKYIDFPFVRGADGTQLLKTNPNEVLTKYLYYYLSSIHIQNAERYERHYKYLKTTRIPVPDSLEIQKSIITECEKVDEENTNAKNQITDCKRKITEIMEKAQSKAKEEVKLSKNECFDISIGRRILSSEIDEQFEIPVYSANVFKPFGKINKLHIEDFSVPSVLWGIDGDWQVNVIPENVKFYPTDHCGVLRIKRNQHEPKYVAWVLYEVGVHQGFKRNYRASIDRIEALTLLLPPYEVQKKAVEQISVLEAKINAAKAVIEECPNRRKQILDNWLK